MGVKQGAVAGDGLNRKRMSNNRKHNWLRKCNKKNIIEKQMKSPARVLTTKPISGKKKRLLNLGKGDKLHARMFKNKAANSMVADE